MDSIENSYSWTIVNDTHFVKHSDKSFFEYNTTGIPKNIKRFFEVEQLKSNDSITVIISFMGIDYNARIVIDNINRAKLVWNSDLNNAFRKESSFSDLDLLIHFDKLSKQHYSVSFESNTPTSFFSFKDEQDWYKEGRKKVITTTQHERNRKNREEAIRIHGTVCMICEFDFEKKYGEPGKNYIEVHHLKPLSEEEDSIPINPETDLICVCSNCHSIIHRKKDGIYTPEEVKEMIEKTMTIPG